MTEGEAKAKLVALWIGKSDDALVSAELELRSGQPNFALNRLYYACFYSITALLFRDGKQFARHSGVKAEFHRAYVKPGQVDKRWGKFYQDLFEDRQRADYVATASFEADDVG